MSPRENDRRKLRHRQTHLGHFGRYVWTTLTMGEKYAPGSGDEGYARGSGGKEYALASGSSARESCSESYARPSGEEELESTTGSLGSRDCCPRLTGDHLGSDGLGRGALRQHPKQQIPIQTEGFFWTSSSFPLTS